MPQAAKPSTTRRALFAAAPAIALAAFVPPPNFAALLPALPRDWETLAAQTESWAANGRDAVWAAYRAGMVLDDFSGAYFSRRAENRAVVLTFGDWSRGPYWRVDHNGAVLHPEGG